MPSTDTPHIVDSLPALTVWTSPAGCGGSIRSRRPGDSGSACESLAYTWYMLMRGAYELRLLALVESLLGFVDVRL